MKRQLLQLAGVLYVAFALVIAHSALVTTKASSSASFNNQSNVAAPERVVLHPERLYQSDSYFNIEVEVKPKTTKDAYTVVVWTGKFCSACAKYKKHEVPALRKLGYRVVFKDYFKDKVPKEVKMLPTIQLNYKGKPIEYKVYWKAKDIDEFIEGRLTLKK